MRLRQLKSLARKGEGQRVEFKKKIDFPEKVLKEIVAFANSQGGNLLIGVDDSGKISGLKDPEEDTYALINAITKFVIPGVRYKIEFISVSPKRSVINFSIFKSKNQIHYIKNGSTAEVFIRKDDRSLKASPEMKVILKQSISPQDTFFNYGEVEHSLMNYLNENRFITVSKLKKIGDVTRKNASQVLVSMVLANVLHIIPGEKEDRFMVKHPAENINLPLDE